MIGDAQTVGLSEVGPVGPTLHHCTLLSLATRAERVLKEKLLSSSSSPS